MRNQAMTLTLEVTPELETRLREEAAKQGISAEEYARILLEEQLLNGPSPMQRGNTPQERKRRLSEWIESNRGLPTLPDEAFQRASFYDERGS
jgi:hypothetical protein